MKLVHCSDVTSKPTNASNGARTIPPDDDSEREPTLEDKRQDAVRYLRERGMYALDRPVQKRNVRPPILAPNKQQNRSKG